MAKVVVSDGSHVKSAVLEVKANILFFSLFSFLYSFMLFNPFALDAIYGHAGGDMDEYDNP